jgi:polysaccharide chain length determinant protein (PEP-CTERM system associated)
MDTAPKTVGEFLEILRRRRWGICLPALVVMAAAGAVALLLPPVYKSSSTILIEEQEIPPEYVMSTVTGYAEKRLQTIQQRIMSFTKLLEVINRFNLYADLRESWATEEIVDQMRKDIKLQTLSADVVDPRTGQPKKATIAFTLSYEGKNPQVVQQVANVLASLYLEENLQVRERQAQETSKFFDEEAKAVRAHLADLEAKIATFKKTHVQELPELLPTNLQGLERSERDIEILNDQIRTQRERESYLQTQLAAIPPSGSEDKRRLDDLRVQLTSLRSRFSDQYPDVVKTRAEIAELEKRLGDRGKPDGGKPGEIVGGQPDNPSYVALAAQLASTKAEIESFRRQMEEVKRKREEYRSRVEATPRVEEEYKALIVERDNTLIKFNDLVRKSMEARVAHGLEREQKGERFTLIDPARLPERPHKPNRLAIIVIGVVMGIGAGAGVGALREFSDRSMRSTDALAFHTSMPVLVAIPVIVTDEERRTRKVRRLAVAGGVLIALVLGVVALHFLVMDLDVLWARLARKAARM